MNDMKEKAMGAVKAFLERKGYEIVDEAWQGPEGIGGIDLVAGTEAGSRVAAPRSGSGRTASPRPTGRAGCARRWRRRGSPATATTTPTRRSASTRWR
ncbi:hypothetical protein [Eggerthella lenta]|uniref:hypothetical protein n=1 Tax=Eggerthella lenta TaxID=84112 RepID=UPI001EE39638|nr:hypothetical protein [Eggerthella lenta]